MKTYETIVQTVLTEKSSNMQTKGMYTFIVKPSATKIDIKKALKEIYGVDVIEVRTLIEPKKIRMIGRSKVFTKRNRLKKAIVRLKDKQTIDPNKIKELKKK